MSAADFRHAMGPGGYRPSESERTDENYLLHIGIGRVAVVWFD
jgi:hypothetical protein